jgi:ATP-dependent phosphofructokinase / diphosphate-dependent phosphofructokinase
MRPTGNVVIAQGGGPTAVINASLYGIVREAARRLEAGSKILGARSGITGVLTPSWTNLKNIGDDEWKRIVASPGAALGSCRKMLSAEEAAAAVRILREKDVRYFFYIGGNDSMDTALKMDRAASSVGYEMACCGIPKTIDNDLPSTDHCPGFGSAARFIAQATLDLGVDVRSLPAPVSVLEVMGRTAGWLTAATLLARRHLNDAPHLIYVPEVALTRERFLSDIQSVYERLGWVVIAVSEGAQDEAGESWGARRNETARDGFGHPLQGDVAARLASLVTSELGLRARSEKPGLLGRASPLTVSHIDRGEAEAVAAFAFSWAIKGNTGFMASIQRHSGSAYEVSYGAAPLESVANGTRLLPLDYVAPGGSNIKEEYRAYVEPLIGGPLAQYASLLGETQRNYAHLNAQGQ